MSEKKGMPPGIEERHSKLCASRSDRRCDCTPTYQASVWDARRGKRIRKTLPTLTRAKAWRRDAAAVVARGELTAPRTTPRIEDALDALIDSMRTGVVLDRNGGRYRPGTVRTYETDVRLIWKPQLGPLRVHEVRRADVQRVVDELRAAKRSGSGIANAVIPLRVLYKRMIRDELITYDPTHNLDRPRVKRKPIDISTVEDREALVAAMTTGFLRALWATALYAGLRRGELRALRWEDVDLDRHVISVEHGWDDVEGEQGPKSDAGKRAVPIMGALRTELLRHKIATGGRGRDLVFGEGDQPFSTSKVHRDSLAAFKAAGLRPPTLQNGRRGMVSHAIEAGLNPKKVQAYVGHASIALTMEVYAHVFPGSIDADRDLLDAHVSRAALARQSAVGQTGADGP